MLSSDASWLAVGSPGDNGNMGATWIFRYNASVGSYEQFGLKLVGTGGNGPEVRQGK